MMLLFSRNHIFHNPHATGTFHLHPDHFKANSLRLLNDVNLPMAKSLFEETMAAFCGLPTVCLWFNALITYYSGGISQTAYLFLFFFLLLEALCEPLVDGIVSGWWHRRWTTDDLQKQMLQMRKVQIIWFSEFFLKNLPNSRELMASQTHTHTHTSRNYKKPSIQPIDVIYLSVECYLQDEGEAVWFGWLAE